ncbi:DUF2510 domain-containing protein [Micropruina sp.]|uniref:DUF2510 domain-containing protein n=1 Tax=Micropruina sp. TaxID=2737536 RepID=UPI00260F5C41|nr:DUF2510 domain-containing protein [Micropruina sp.]
MAQPGWYPDPGGQQGMFRYWDGSAWTQQLSANPGGAPSGPGGRNPAMLWAIIAGVVVLALIAAFTLPSLFGGGPSASSSGPVPPAPTISAWDENSTPTPSRTPTPTPTRTPTPTPTPSRPETSLPCPRYDTAVVNGRLFGGGLSVPVIRDSRWSVNAVRTIPWGICATGLQRQITGVWVSEVILAGIQPRSRVGSLKEQADAIADDSVGRFYNDGRGKLVMKSSKAIQLDGLDAWELRYEVRIDYLGSIPGDNVNVVVVQHTDGSRSALMTFATIGDSETQRQVDASRSAVKVEKR